jgi:hypothetical protein
LASVRHGILFLVIIITLAYSGIAKIVGNAGEVILGNELDAEFKQKEVDHLLWTEAVNSLLTDPTVTELHAQTDDHKCALGSWLYGPPRERAESEIPQLAPILASMEAPHARLHASARKIASLYKPVDVGLGEFLLDKKSITCTGFKKSRPRCWITPPPISMCKWTIPNVHSCAGSILRRSPISGNRAGLRH